MLSASKQANEQLRTEVLRMHVCGSSPEAALELGNNVEGLLCNAHVDVLEFGPAVRVRVPLAVDALVALEVELIHDLHDCLNELLHGAQM